MSAARHRAGPASWIAGVAVALGTVWVASWCLVDSIEPTRWQPRLDVAMPVAGSVHRHRREGWATTHYGRFGIPGVPDPRALPWPRLAIWGNSHVAGLSLADDEKVAARVMARWRRHATTPLGAYAVGIGGGDVAHVHHRIGAYQALAPAALHVVVVTEMDFLDPSSDPHAEHALVDGVFQHSPRRPDPRVQRVIATLHRLRLDFLAFAALRARDLDVRWRLGVVRRDRAADVATEERGERPRWDRILEQMARRAGAPVVYLYVPGVPRLLPGGLLTVDPEAERFAGFERACAVHRVRCRDLSRELVAAFHASGRFPRGFANHRPDRGHLNALGTDLVAAAVVNEWRRALD